MWTHIEPRETFFRFSKGFKLFIFHHLEPLMHYICPLCSPLCSHIHSLQLQTELNQIWNNPLIWETCIFNFTLK